MRPRPESGQRFLRSDRRGRPFASHGPRVGLAEAPLPAQSRLGRKAREPAREVMILAIALGHPSLLEAHWEELAALDFAGKKLASFRDALIAAPAEAMQSPEALAEALSAAGQAEERDANSCAGGQNAQLVVSARGRRAFRRRACAKANAGLASAGGRVK